LNDVCHNVPGIIYHGTVFCSRLMKRTGFNLEGLSSTAGCSLGIFHLALGSLVDPDNLL